MNIMSKLRGDHFEWLAKDIVKLIKPNKLDDFVREVKHYAKNNRFQESRFRDSCAITLQAQQYDDGLAPELYQGRY